jgi:aminopeptidase N
VDVQYTGLYRRDGIGLHRYKDSENGEMYLYTLLESFSANKCFPCFDQPDIKATMQFFSFSPEKWKVISNENEESVTKTQEVYKAILEKIGCSLDIAERQETEGEVFKQFCQTKKISTYFFAFVVGPYIFERNKLPGAENYTPMRIFARKSMMKYVNYEEFFRLSMAGIDYYKDFFGCDYPFSKYDKIYVPEFNCGAIENVGCVTYIENYLDREEIASMVKRHRRAITILH